MDLAPFIRREHIKAVRRGEAWKSRGWTIAFGGIFIAGHFVLWDWSSMDRLSVGGAQKFALQLFASLMAVQALGILGGIPVMVAPMIAGERDRKSLDAVLASSFTSAEMVLGPLCAAMLRYLDGLVAMVPLSVLIMIAGGIDPALLIVGALALFSTALVIATISIFISIHARTGPKATSSAVGYSIFWIAFPFPTLILLPRFYPQFASWVSPVLRVMLDSSPLAPLTHLAGIVPRGTLAEVLARMIGYQAIMTVTILALAIFQLRKASRAVYDAEGRSILKRLLSGRWRKRPPCGDDPLIWRELYSVRRRTGILVIIDRIATLTWIGCFVYATSLFAIPAFNDLLKTGYTASPGHVTLPDLNPMARVLVQKVSPGTVNFTVDHPRLEFNVMIRQLTGVFEFVLVLMIAGVAAEGVIIERERDTWLGLIATPVSGWEIVRAKMFGAFWTTRTVTISFLALWITGLVTGAVHPIGFLAVVAELIVTCWLLSAIGVMASLRARDRSQATSRAVGPLLILSSLGILPWMFPGIAAAVFASFVSIPFQMWASFLSYEDVRALVEGRTPPQYTTIVSNGRHAWILVGSLLTNIGCIIALAFVITRHMVRTFDAVIGRPVQPKQPPQAIAEIVPPAPKFAQAS